MYAAFARADPRVIVQKKNRLYKFIMSIYNVFTTFSTGVLCKLNEVLKLMYN